MNLGKPTKVAKLNETMAIELGASLMGELIIFSVAGACIIFEYNRQVTKETKKEEVRQMQIQKFTDDIQALHNTTLQQEAQIHYLQSAINELARHTKHKLPEPISWQKILILRCWKPLLLMSMAYRAANGFRKQTQQVRIHH